MEPFSAVVSGVWTLLSWTRPALTSNDIKDAPPKFEKDIEPFSLIIDLACASYLPDNSRPTLKRHHIVYDKPAEWHVGSVTVDTQGFWRSVTNFKGNALAKRNVVQLWNKVIIQAIKFYPPNKEGNDIERGIYERAIIGAQKIRKTYQRLKDAEKSDDPTPELLDGCIQTIKESLKVRENQKEEYLEELPAAVDPQSTKVKVASLWNKSHIMYIDSMFKEAFAVQGDTDPSDNFKCEKQLTAILKAIEERCSIFESILQKAHVYDPNV